MTTRKWFSEHVTAAAIRRAYMVGAIVSVVLMLGVSLGVMISADPPESAPITVIDGEGLEAYKVNGIRYANPNDVDSIQDALDDMTSGGLLVIPGGTYTLTENIQVSYNNTAVIGTGPETVIVNDAFAEGGGVWGTFEVMGTSSVFKNNIYIGNLMVQVENKQIDAITLRYVTNITVTDIWVRGTGTSGEEAIHAEAVQNAVFSNIFVEGTGDAGNFQIDINGEAASPFRYSENVVVDNVVLTDAIGGSGLEIRGVTGCVVTNVHVSNALAGIVIQVDNVAGIFQTTMVQVSQFTVNNTDYEGVSIKGSASGGKITDVTLSNGIIKNTGKMGVYVERAQRVALANLKLIDCGSVDSTETSGISLNTGAFGRISDVSVVNCDIVNASRPSTASNGVRGIDMKYVNRAVISGNRISGAAHHGIQAYMCQNVTFSSNIIYNNGQLRASSSGIELIGEAAVNTKNCIVANNQVYDDQGSATQHFGVREPSNADYNLIEGNRLWGVLYNLISKTGTNTIVRDNIGYLTENYGAQTITGAVSTVVVTHGLGSAGYGLTPTVIVVTGNNTGIGYYVVTAVTTTTFTITFENQPGASEWKFYWYVRAW